MKLPTINRLGMHHEQLERVVSMNKNYFNQFGHKHPAVVSEELRLANEISPKVGEVMAEARKRELKYRKHLTPQGSELWN